ncbi:MAG: YkgJ family cysteine cluster protein [Proteobacteria bacterium]|nr:YkgJ family cysteine cluster protein [Pseudomonadota bacterium]
MKRKLESLMKSEKDGDITCRRCGACCHVDMIAYVSPEDIQRWEKEQRYDILDRLHDNNVFWAGDRIINKFGTSVTSCFYLNWDVSFFSCEIYETRPMICRNFIPGSSELCPLYYRQE